MVAVAVSIPARGLTAARESTGCSHADVTQRAQKALAQHSHFCGRTNLFEFAEQNAVLVVRGTVPSFYLKQVLQTVLREVDGVRSIDNQVDVVACDGLSSTRGS